MSKNCFLVKFDDGTHEIVNKESILAKGKIECNKNYKVLWDGQKFNGKVKMQGTQSEVKAKLKFISNVTPVATLTQAASTSKSQTSKGNKRTKSSSESDSDSDSGSRNKKSSSYKKSKTTKSYSDNESSSDFELLANTPKKSKEISQVSLNCFFIALFF